ncbi:MAG: hypothetical protein ACQES4_11335 [Bacillota bacterium]
MTIRAEANNSINKGNKKCVYDRLMSNFLRLDKVLDREREAIMAFEEEDLKKSETKIDNLLSDISEVMLSADRLDPEQTKDLAAVIARVKEKRQNNHMLLQDVIQETGQAIVQAKSGKRVLRAYNTPRTGEEFFIKKEC